VGRYQKLVWNCVQTGENSRVGSEKSLRVVPVFRLNWGYCGIDYIKSRTCTKRTIK